MQKSVAPVAPSVAPVPQVFPQLSGGVAPVAPVAPPGAKMRYLRVLYEVARFTLTANYSKTVPWPRVCAVGCHRCHRCHTWPDLRFWVWHRCHIGCHRCHRCHARDNEGTAVTRTTRSVPAVRSQPVLWWLLINEAEELRARSGWGLASVWRWIHLDDYLAARTELDRVKSALAPSPCAWLCDFCATCAAAEGCSRFDAIVEPDEIEWPGSGTVTARYRCGCGHEWTCSWSSELLTAPTLHAAKGS